MEAQVERLQCELARLTAYETSFHDVQWQLDLAKERNEELEVERDNLHYINQDALREFDNVKEQLARLQLKRSADERALNEHRSRIQSLKEQLVQQYERAGGESESEGAEDIEAFRGERPDGEGSPLRPCSRKSSSAL